MQFNIYAVIKRSISIWAFILMSVLVAGCGGTKCFIDSCGDQLNIAEVILLKSGEDKKIFRYKTGIMWGGYIGGLFPEDENIVKVWYDSDGSKYNAYIKGVNQGTTKVYFVNRFGAGAEELDEENRDYWLDYYSESKNYFIVIVE